MTNSSHIEEITEESFSQRVLRSELPVLVVICVNGNGADQGFLRLPEEWSSQARSRLRICRLSAEGSSGLAERFGIPLAPGLALFSRGVMCYQFIGEASQTELDELLARASTLEVFRGSKDASDRRIVEPRQIAD